MLALANTIIKLAFSFEYNMAHKEILYHIKRYSLFGVEITKHCFLFNIIEL